MNKQSSGNVVVDAILNDEVVKAEDLGQEDLTAVDNYHRFAKAYLGTDSTTFEKLDRFKRVYGMLKE